MRPASAGAARAGILLCDGQSQASRARLRSRVLLGGIVASLAACRAPAPVARELRAPDEPDPARAARQEPTAPQEDDLSAQATDPTASLMSLSFIGDYTGAYTDDRAGLDDDGFDLNLRLATPFQAFGQANILRVTVPYRLDGRGSEGLGDVAVVDVVPFDRPWGRWMVGVVASLAADPAAADSIAAGPAWAVVTPVRKDLLLGIFQQNLFAGDTGISQFQPVAAWQLGGGWALSAGDLQFVYDWEDSRWLAVPLGMQLGVVAPVAGQPLRFALNPQYNLVDDDGLEEWSIALTVSLLAPTR